MPGSDIPDAGIKGLDKLVHCFMYTVLSFLLIIALHKQFIFSYRRYKVKFIAVTTAFSFGVLMEIVQQFLCLTRGFELLDVVANAVGCAVGVLIFKIVYSKN